MYVRITVMRPFVVAVRKVLGICCRSSPDGGSSSRRSHKHESERRGRQSPTKDQKSGDTGEAAGDNLSIDEAKYV